MNLSWNLGLGTDRKHEKLISEKLKTNKKKNLMLVLNAKM